MDITVFVVLHVLATAGAIAALIFAFKLYRETDRGWYWLCLLASAFFLALEQLLGILPPFPKGFEILFVLREASEIIGGLLLGLSFYGIYKTMKEVRKRVE